MDCAPLAAAFAQVFRTLMVIRQRVDFKVGRKFYYFEKIL